MEAVAAFLKAVIAQRASVEEIIEYDSMCLSPSAWKKRVGRLVETAFGSVRRKGWTTRDKLREWHLRNAYPQMPNIWSKVATPLNRPVLKRHADRLAMMFVFFDLRQPIIAAGKVAMDFCNCNPQFIKSAGGAVSELLAVHLRWLDYMKANKGYPASIESEWDSCKDRLAGLVEAISELGEDSVAKQTNNGLPKITVLQNGVSISGEIFALTPKQHALVELLYQHEGEYISLTENDYRTRFIESLPSQVQHIIESQPGAGTRIHPKWFN